MRYLAVSTALLFLAMFLPSHGLAEPVVSIQRSYYTVSGKTENDIRADINAKTPVSENGRKFDAHTKWHVRWNFWWHKSSTACKITRVETKVDIQQILPKLVEDISLPETLSRKWRAYLQALIGHEDGHKSIGLSAAKEIEERLRGMAPGLTCKELESEANATAKGIIVKYARQEKEYDRRTRHGMNEGAVFP